MMMMMTMRQNNQTLKIDNKKIQINGERNLLEVLRKAREIILFAEICHLYKN